MSQAVLEALYDSLHLGVEGSELGAGGVVLRTHYIPVHACSDPDGEQEIDYVILPP